MSGRAVAGYYRVSVARDDMKAPELYEEDIRRYCAYRRLTLARIYSDVDFSAFRGAKARPSLKELVRDRAQYGAVVVPKLSRFGRSMKELVGLFDVFDSDAIPLVFLDMDLDTSTSQGRLLRHILAAFAEYESDVRSDYARATIERRARRGLPNGTWIAYGYKKDGPSYEVSHPECDIVEAIFGFYAAGETMTGIARLLNDAGVASPGGRKWAKPTVRKMLDNHHYAGLLMHDGALRRGAWPTIVSHELWDAVQTRRAQTTNLGIRPTVGLYLLSGRIECGVCGKTLHHRTRQDRVPGQYLCRGTAGSGCPGGGIAEHRAEDMVVKALLARYGGAMVHAPELAAAPVPFAVFWAGADLNTRRHMLASAIERLVLIPRPEGNPRGTGMPRGRRLTITWAMRAPPEAAEMILATGFRPADTAKVCKACGRRKHISNFRLDGSSGDGRTDSCSRCRPPAPEPVEESQRSPSKPMSYQREWRLFRQECQERRDTGQQ